MILCDFYMISLSKSLKTTLSIEFGQKTVEKQVCDRFWNAISDKNLLLLP